MALKTKEDMNNEQWQPLQDDWPTLTGTMCVAELYARSRCVCSLCVRGSKQVKHRITALLKKNPTTLVTEEVLLQAKYLQCLNSF